MGFRYAVTASSFASAMRSLLLGGITAFATLICWHSPLQARLCFGTILLLVPFFGLFFFPVLSVVGVLSCVSGICGLALSLHTVSVIDKRTKERRGSPTSDGGNSSDAEPNA
jgi:hypothetical protein